MNQAPAVDVDIAQSRESTGRMGEAGLRPSPGGSQRDLCRNWQRLRKMPIDTTVLKRPG
jgi:hypothetical protein